MVKIFNHYLNGRTLLQIFSYAALLVFAVIVSLRLQVNTPFWDMDAVRAGAGRGLLMVAGMVAVNFALGLYARPRKLKRGQVRARAVLSFLGSAGIAFLVLKIFPLPPPYENDPAMGIILSVLVGALVLRFFDGDIVSSLSNRQRVLIFGTGRHAQMVGQSLTKNDPGLELVGYVAGPRENALDAAIKNCIHYRSSLVDIAKEHQVNEIVVALNERRGGSMPLREMLECKVLGIHVIDVATHFEKFLGQIHLDAISAGWLIFGDGFRQGFFRSAVKWLMDVIGSSLLLVITSPVMLITALMIFLESGGPVFYSQERVGLHGRVFKVLKFRSMRKDAEKDGTPRWASAADDRITRVGKIIRKMRIDELPQLLCVLKGDMSLVGPRPERPYFVEQLTSDIPYYAIRHSIKPGLTGWAQVRYHYGSSIEDTQKKLQYDLYYVKNHSWFLDLVILFETVGVVLTGKGAQ